MTDIRDQPFFQSAFPGYATCLVKSSPLVGPTASGQARYGYYMLPSTPPLGYATQHLLLPENPHGLPGSFEEPCIRQNQATMTLNIISVPGTLSELKRFILLLLVCLLDKLQYSPSKEHPIILRGADAAFSGQLQRFSTWLGFPEGVSNRSYCPGFSYSRDMPQPMTPDPRFAPFIEACQAYLLRSLLNHTPTRAFEFSTGMS